MCYNIPMYKEILCSKCLSEENECCFVRMTDFIANGTDMTLEERIGIIEEMREDAYKRKCPKSDYLPIFPECSVIQ